MSCKSEDPETWIRLVGMEGLGWEAMERGRNGYRKGLYYGSVCVLYDGNEGMGTCLDMSGQGCRAFEEYGSGDFDGLFRLARDDPENFHIARLDVALDDHTGILDIQRLFQDTDNLEFVTKFRKARIVKEFDNGQPGISVYHGSRKSEVLLRIYDKAAERGLPEDRHWIRTELQLRDERALAFTQRPEPIGEAFRGVLGHYLRYVDPNPMDSNTRRWPTKGYWADLLAEAARIPLYVKPGVEYNISQLENFVFNQAGSAISAMLEIVDFPVFMERMRRKREEGVRNPKYERLVQEYGRRRRREKQPEVRPADGQGHEVHRGLPGGQLLGTPGEPGPGLHGTPGQPGHGLGPPPGPGLGQAHGAPEDP